MSEKTEKVLIASDICHRDGIGVELYENDELIIEIFRDDSELTRTVTLFNKSVSLDQLERAIETFKNEVPWDFIPAEAPEDEPDG